MNASASSFPELSHKIELPGDKPVFNLGDSDDLNGDHRVSVGELRDSNTERILQRLQKSVDYAQAAGADPAPGTLSVNDAAKLIAQLPNKKLAGLFVMEIGADKGIDRQAVFASSLFSAMGEGARDRFELIAEIASTTGRAQLSPVQQHALGLWMQAVPKPVGPVARYD
jgi:hypothetical protein